MTISDYERLLWVLAEEMESSIQSVFDKTKEEHEWVDSVAEAEALMRRMRGTFIASLVGEIEEKINRSFSSVFDQLPNSPTAKGSQYWFVDMPSTSTPRGRAKVMWAIRIVYTHGNGHIDQVDDPDVAVWLEHAFASQHLRGVRIKDDIVTIFNDATFPALKTALEINDRFGS